MNLTQIFEAGTLGGGSLENDQTGVKSNTGQQAASPWLSSSGGIYVHIPFCRHKCRYCDFYSITDLSLRDVFLQGLIQEACLAAETCAFRVDTIYLGGGTPSLLPPGDIAAILDVLQQCYAFEDEPEVTIETNPGTLDSRRLKTYAQAGVNRLVVGVQSFQEHNLRFLGRVHSAAEAIRTVRQVQDAGWENIGIDLIYGLPGQSRRGWQHDLEQAVALGPQHLSCYLLTYEAGTPLALSRQKGQIRPLAQAAAATLFEQTHLFLPAQGYIAYELSNFTAGPRFQSRHNRKYWQGAPYIGLGPSAHSYLPPGRCWNQRDLRTYLQVLEAGRRPLAGEETLTCDQQMIEAIYTGLRTSRGLDRNQFQRQFGRSLEALFGAILQPLEAQGYLVVSPQHWALTTSGMAYHNHIVRMFIDQI